MFEVSTFSTEQIIPHIPILQEWVKRDYLEYPYLWVPSDAECFMDMFVNEKNALVTIVKKGEHVVGVAAGMPFNSEGLEPFFEHPINAMAKARGFDPSRILYMSFFLTAPEHRNEKMLVSAIYDAYLSFAKKLNLTHVCYWSEIEPENHPLKSQYPTTIEPWGIAINGFRNMNLQLDLYWPTLQVDGSIKNAKHVAEFYIKEL
jgi:hypothetical protein